MVKRIGRRTARKKYPSLPIANWRTESFNYPEVFASYILSIPNKRNERYLKELLGGLSNLLKALEIDRLVFLGDNSIPWLFREAKRNEAKSAFNFLRSMGVKDNYTGGFIVNVRELPEFMSHIFWLSRINAVSFDIHFVDVNQSIVGHPCKDWNLHFSTRTKAVDKEFKNAISKSGLTTIERC